MARPAVARVERQFSQACIEPSGTLE